jgi:hypothetical protein
MRAKQFAWTLLALVFLGVSWLWETFAPLVQAIIDLLPLRRLKAWAHAQLQRLAPYPTLLVFLIPLALSEVIKVISFVAFARLGAVSLARPRCRIRSIVRVARRFDCPLRSFGSPLLSPPLVCPPLHTRYSFLRPSTLKYMDSLILSPI